MARALSNKTLQELSLTELKAFAYEQLVSIEQAQNNLKIINQEIYIRQNASVEPQNDQGQEQIPEVMEDTTTSENLK